MAKISYHAAVAANMNFGVKASGTSPVETRNALVSNFRFHSNADRDVNVNDETMREEIRWMRPVILSGTRPDGGAHGWVVHGYNENTDQFLMNFGHGGSGDNWYTYDNITFTDKEFNDGQVYIHKLAPEETVGFVGGAAGGTGSPDSPYKDIETAIDKADNGETLIFKAGSVNTFSSGTLEISQPLTLKGCDITIKKE